jgi:nucleoside diphosphate kinase
MAIERTFSMIKPDATKRNLTGAITKMLEDAGLRVVASKRVWMSRARRKASTPSTRTVRSSANCRIHVLRPDHRAGSRRRERHR